MRYGREDCAGNTVPKAKDEYPSPKAGLNATAAYFAKEFGLTESETVALLGE